MTGELKKVFYNGGKRFLRKMKIIEGDCTDFYQALLDEVKKSGGLSMYIIQLCQKKI